MKIETYPLKNGTEISKIGLGAFRIQPADCEKTVAAAIQSGYRLIDTANVYMNERAVGGMYVALFPLSVPLHLVNFFAYPEGENAHGQIRRRSYIRGGSICCSLSPRGIFIQAETNTKMPLWEEKE